MFPGLFNLEDSTFEAIFKIWDEIMDMFPNAPYLHIGGDETVQTGWYAHMLRCIFNLFRRLSSQLVRDKMQKLGLVSGHDVHHYFVKQIANHIESKGRKAIGWDEIFEISNLKKSVGSLFLFIFFQTEFFLCSYVLEKMGALFAL